jgi:hypothetical protein
MHPQKIPCGATGAEISPGGCSLRTGNGARKEGQAYGQGPNVAKRGPAYGHSIHCGYLHSNPQTMSTHNASPQITLMKSLGQL